MKMIDWFTVKGDHGFPVLWNNGNVCIHKDKFSCFYVLQQSEMKNISGLGFHQYFHPPWGGDLYLLVTYEINKQYETRYSCIM